MAAWIFKMLNPKLLRNIHCLHYDHNTHDKGTLVRKIDTSGFFCFFFCVIVFSFVSFQLVSTVGLLVLDFSLVFSSFSVSFSLLF